MFSLYPICGICEILYHIEHYIKGKRGGGVCVVRNYLSNMAIEILLCNSSE